MGYLYENGLGVQSSANQAFKYYEQSCELDTVDGCYNAAIAKAKGNGVKIDLKKAAEFLEKGCDLGDDESCNDYNELRAFIGY